MSEEKFDDLPEINEISGKEEKEKKKGFAPWLGKGGKEGIGSIARGKAPKSGLSRFFRRIFPRGAGSSAAGAGTGAARTGASLGLRSSSVFGRGFGSLFSSKAGLLGLLLGGATIAAGAFALYNLASSPGEKFTPGLFQGSYYESLADDAEAATLQADANQNDGALADYFNPGDERAEDLGAVYDPSEEAGFEEGAVDADEVAEEVAKPKELASAKPQLQKTGGIGAGGGGSGGGASAALGGKSFAAGQSSSSKGQVRAGKKKGYTLRAGKAANPYGQAKFVKNWVGDAKGRDRQTAKAAMIDAYKTGLLPSGDQLAVDMEGKGLGDKGVGIGKGGGPGKGSTGTGSGQGLYSGQGTKLGNYLNEDDLNNNEDGKPKGLKKLELRAMLLALAAIVAIIFAGKLANKPGAWIWAKVAAAGALALIHLACLTFNKMKEEYPDYVTEWQGWVYKALRIGIGVAALYIIITGRKAKGTEEEIAAKVAKGASMSRKLLIGGTLVGGLVSFLTGKGGGDSSSDGDTGDTGGDSNSGGGDSDSGSGDKDTDLGPYGPDK